MGESLGERGENILTQSARQPKSQRKQHAKCNHNSRCLSQSQKPNEPTSQNCLCSTLTFLFICLLCNSETYIFHFSFFFFLFAYNARRVVYVRFHLRMPRGEPTLAVPFTMAVFMHSAFFNCPFFVHFV